MPNAKILSEKQAIVEELVQRISGASSGVFVDYRGVTVAQDTEIRRELRKNDVQYNVVKNTLTRFAANKIGFEALDPILNGTSSLATTTGDPIAPFRIFTEYSKKLNGMFAIKAGFMDGRILTEEEVRVISELPSKEALYAKVLGTMLAPITSLAVCLGQILEQKGGSAPSAASADEGAAGETPEEAQAEAAPTEEAQTEAATAEETADQPAEEKARDLL